jgi:ferredoxin-NADP reductase
MSSLLRNIALLILILMVRRTRIYICGTSGTMKAFAEGLTALGFAHFDFFRELLTAHISQEQPRNEHANRMSSFRPRSRHVNQRFLFDVKN